VSPSFPRLLPERRSLRLAPGDAVEGLQVEGGRVDLTVVLSNHFVRYALLPWSDSLDTPEEEEAFARHQFTRIYGERAAAWTFRCSEGAAGDARLASAIDTELLEKLRATFAQPPVRLVSVQPELMAVYNRHRKAVPAEGAWLVLLEPGRACIALRGPQGWLAVRNARLQADDAESWIAQLDQERRRVGGDTPALALLHAPGGLTAIPEAPGWRFQALPNAVFPYAPAA
jgi:hypothetical protein